MVLIDQEECEGWRGRLAREGALEEKAKEFRDAGGEIYIRCNSSANHANIRQWLSFALICVRLRFTTIPCPSSRAAGSSSCCIHPEPSSEAYALTRALESK